MNRIENEHLKTRSKLYFVWVEIGQRCNNPKNKQHKDYGERGIKRCEEWNSFISFGTWAIKNGYRVGLSIDRINNDGNYEPSNCRWVTREIQARNTQLIRRDNSSGFRGVGFNKKSKKFQVHIGVSGKQINLGFFEKAIDGAYVYDKYVIDNNLEHTTNGLYKKEVA